MWLSEIQLADFRNYSQLQLQLAPGATLFHGENGEGKTNLVEAVGFLSNLESHRSGQQKNLIRTGSQRATIACRVNHEKRNLLVAAEINSGETNRFYLNSKPQKRASDIVGHLQAIIFAPEDLDIVRRDPADRRSFLDSSLALLRPALAALKLDYDRVLKQRNALLKSARGVKNPELSTLDIWDDQLIDLGSRLTEARLDLLTKLADPLQDFYTALAGEGEAVTLSLVSLSADDDVEQIDRAAIADSLRAKLESNRHRELERGITLVGPHRDELLIEKSGQVARNFASQGEAWSLALGLKLALAQLLRDGPGGDPILILDDVFAVLDPGRRRRLIEFVTSFEQVLVTAADLGSTPDIGWAQSFLVRGGELSANQL